MELRRGTFSLNGSPDEETTPRYAGYTTGQTWHGWAMPYFTKEVADQICEPWNTAGQSMSATYDAATDTYTFCDPEGGMEPDSYTGADYVADGQALHLYDIGAGCWVWDEE